jgi:hypothetical protein
MGYSMPALNHRNSPRIPKMGNRILLVDDDRDYMELLAGKLRAIGFDNLLMVDSPWRQRRPLTGESFSIWP